MSPRSSARVNSTSFMHAGLGQDRIDRQLPVNPLLFRPMRVQSRHLFVAFGRKRGMPIRDRRFATPLAVWNNSDLDLVCRETWRDKHVLYAALFRVVGREQPK